GHTNANDRVPRREVLRLFRPDAVDTAVHQRHAAVVADEATFGIEGLIGPGIVLEGLTAVRGTGEYDDLRAIFWVAPTIVENDVHRDVRSIYRDSLKQLIWTIVDRKRNHPSNRNNDSTEVLRQQSQDVEAHLT